MIEDKYENMTDLQLVQMTLAIDKEYFRGILLRYQNQIFAYLFRLLNFNRHETEDCVSQAFINAYTKLTSYQPERTFSSWIYRVAHNVAIDHIRKNSGKFLTFDPEQHSDIPISQTNEFKDKLDFILSKLSLEDKNILILFYIQGLSQQDLSDLYNLLPNTVAVKIKRAKEKAKKLIAIYYPENTNS